MRTHTQTHARTQAYTTCVLRLHAHTGTRAQRSLSRSRTHTHTHTHTHTQLDCVAGARHLVQVHTHAVYTLNRHACTHTRTHTHVTAGTQKRLNCLRLKRFGKIKSDSALLVLLDVLVGCLGVSWSFCTELRYETQKHSATGTWNGAAAKFPGLFHILGVVAFAHCLWPLRKPCDADAVAFNTNANSSRSQSAQRNPTSQRSHRHKVHKIAKRTTSQNTRRRAARAACAVMFESAPSRSLNYRELPLRVRPPIGIDQRVLIA